MKNKIEKWFKFLDFYGLIHAVAILQFLVFVITLMLGTRADSYLGALSLNFEKIFQGQIWRLFTFFLTSTTFISPMFCIFTLLFMIFLADIIYSSWSNIKVNLFFLLNALIIIIGGFIFYLLSPNINNNYIAFYFTSFYFMQFIIISATILRPDEEIFLFLVLPVKIKWIGLFYGISIIFTFIQMPQTQIIIALSSISFITVFLPSFLFFTKKTKQDISKIMNETDTPVEPFNTCHKCNKTDISHPSEHFRIFEDDNEYCSNCLNKIKND